VIFWTPFSTFLIDFDAIGIYRKTAPTKSTVLGARPPPWENYKFYRFFVIFTVLGAFNRAGKTVTKIGIYSKPPPKMIIYSDFIVCDPIYRYFNNSRPITELFPLNFLVPVLAYTDWKTKQFFCFLLLDLLSLLDFGLSKSPTKNTQTERNARTFLKSGIKRCLYLNSLTRRRRERGRGRLTRRKQQYQAIVHYPI
jgi:hypothetical protein